VSPNKFPPFERGEALEFHQMNTRVLRSVYYNVDTGFGGIDATLRQARALDPSITRADVRKFLEAQEIRQRKKPKRYNSFVPSGRLDQIQVDLADFGADKKSSGSKDEEPKARYGFVAIDSFTKRAVVVPIRDKTGASSAPALEVALRVLGLPDTLVSDEGGEFQAPEFKQVLRYFALDHLALRTPPIFVERFIRTLKEKIAVRLLAKRGKHWTDVLAPVLRQYNMAPHTTTGLPPLEAENPDNEEAVHARIESRARWNRSYPEIEVGDRVKIIRKPGKYSEYKASFNSWSEKAYTVASITHENGQARYFLAGYSEPGSGHVRKPLLRHELLRVEGVEPAPEESA
jgi:hypothetical protein